MEINLSGEIAVDGRPLSRCIKSCDAEKPFIFGKLGQLRLEPPFVLRFGETRFTINQLFAGDAQRFEEFLKSIMSHWQYLYHSYWKRYRKSVSKLRNRQRRNNYKKSRKTAFRAKAKWTDKENALILAENGLSDADLSLQIGRSVQAIQIRRARLKIKKGIIAVVEQG